MQAIRLHEVQQPLQLDSLPEPAPGPGEVVVEVKAAALNRRDYWITQGMYPGMALPCTLGSDGCGKVIQTGDDVAPDWMGREVILNPGIHWGEDQAAQCAEFEILGMPRAGTAATHVVASSDWLHDKPQHLTAEQAAALPLAGVTAFRSVFTRGKLQAGDTMLVTGIGGGVATLALQFGVAAGAKVLVTSSSPAKLERAAELGAAGGYNYREDGWHKSLRKEHGAPNVTIDSAGGKGYAQLVDIAAPGGRIVNYGATTGPIEQIDMFKIFWKQLNLLGSTMGSPQDFADMLEFVTSHKITPVIDRTARLEECQSLLDLMQSHGQFGKLVLLTQ